MNFLSTQMNKFFCRIFFKKKLGYSLDLSAPETFNEKIQYLKILQRDPIFTKLTDKYLVREYVREKIGKKYLNKIYGVYSNLESLRKDIKKFPDKFVLKMNHASGWNIIVKNKNEFGKREEKQLKKWLKINYYNHNSNGFLRYKGELNYKNIKPLIICEEFLEDNEGQLLDYKFFCFDGEPKFIEVDVDRFSDHKRCFYDLNWIKQNFTIKYPLYNLEINEPINLEEMIIIAKKLSYGFKHVRVDLYNIDGRVLFGEMTFYHGSGTEIFDPVDWDLKLGKMINLDK